MMQLPSGPESLQPTIAALPDPPPGKPLKEPCRSGEYALAKRRVRSIARDCYFMGAVFLFLGLALLHETLAMTGALASLGDLLRPFFIIVVAVGMCDILLGVGIARRSRPVIAASIALYVLPSLGGLLFGGPLLGLFDAQVSDTSLHIDPVIYLLVAVSIFGIGGVFQLLGLLRAYRAIGVLRQRDASVPASTDLLAQQ